jgi:hypothetical protein
MGILFYAAQYTISMREKLKKVHIKIQKDMQETNLENFYLLHFRW